MGKEGGLWLGKQREVLGCCLFKGPSQYEPHNKILQGLDGLGNEAEPIGEGKSGAFVKGQVQRGGLMQAGRLGGPVQA